MTKMVLVIAMILLVGQVFAISVMPEERALPPSGMMESSTSAKPGPSFSIDLSPSRQRVQAGEETKFILTITDRRELPACLNPKPGQPICSLALEPISYAIWVSGLPFQTEFEQKFTLLPGEKKVIPITVDTGMLAPNRPVIRNGFNIQAARFLPTQGSFKLSVSVAKGKEVQQARAILMVLQRTGEREGSGQGTATEQAPAPLPTPSPIPTSTDEENRHEGRTITVGLPQKTTMRMEQDGVQEQTAELRNAEPAKNDQSLPENQRTVPVKTRVSTFFDWLFGRQ